MTYEEYEECEEYEETIDPLDMFEDINFDLELYPLVFKKYKKQKNRKRKETLDPKNIFEAEIIEQRKKRLKDSLKALNR